MKRSVCQKVVSTILILACILPSAMLSTSAYSEQTLSPTRRYSMTLKPGETKTLSTPVVVSAGSSVVWLVIWIAQWVKMVPLPVLQIKMASCRPQLLRLHQVSNIIISTILVHLRLYQLSILSKLNKSNLVAHNARRYVSSGVMCFV